MKKEKRINGSKVYSVLATIVFAAIIAVLGYMLVKNNKETKTASENTYNMAFYEVVDYVQNVETYLAKSLISSTPEHGAETLTNVWREANLAQAYLSQLPIESQELENTEKFLNRPALVAVSNTSGLAGIAHWMNAYYKLSGERAVDKSSPVVTKVKEWVDAEYEAGRVTVITDEELVRVITDVCHELQIVL